MSPRSLSPAPSQVPPMGTLWLWGAVPLLLFLLACLAALGRDIRGHGVTWGGAVGHTAAEHPQPHPGGI